jgi:hypothetical protein
MTLAACSNCLANLAPLVLDAFAIHLWASPYTSCLISGSWTGTWVGIAVITFAVSFASVYHAAHIHNRTGLVENALFRAAWLFTATKSVKNRIGSGVLPLVLVAFLPLIYVRVAPDLPSVAAIYAILYFLLTGSRGTQVTAVCGNSSAFTMCYVWVSFIISCGHHSAWVHSHTHYIELSGFRKWVYRSPLHTTFFRTVVVALCMLFPQTQLLGKPATLGTLRTLFLLSTISTFTAWTHCQHKETECFSNILVSTVFPVVSALIVETIEHTTAVLIVITLLIAIELFAGARRLGYAKERVF